MSTPSPSPIPRRAPRAWLSSALAASLLFGCKQAPREPSPALPTCVPRRARSGR